MVLEGGKVVERQQLVGFSESVTPQEQISLDPGLIGKAAEFDFSRLDIGTWLCNAIFLEY